MNDANKVDVEPEEPYKAHEIVDVKRALMRQEIEQLRAQCEAYEDGLKGMKLANEALRAQLEAAQADAARYRAIREGLEVDENSGIVVSLIDDFGGETLRGAEADAAIDAARATLEGKT